MHFYACREEVWEMVNEAVVIQPALVANNNVPRISTIVCLAIRLGLAWGVVMAIPSLPGSLVRLGAPFTTGLCSSHGFTFPARLGGGCALFLATGGRKRCC